MNSTRIYLKSILASQTNCLPVPGCWDGLSARLIAQAGFPVAFLSGGAHAMGRFGLPDMGFVSLAELAETTRIITDCTNTALIVDADTGFGNALNTAQTMRMLERAGASAIQIEDQTSPKRCGHMADKNVIPPQLAAGKIMAAVDARTSSDTLVVGRTDAASREGIEAAIARAHLYLEAGADLIFIEGPSTIFDMKLIQVSFGGHVPLVHNMVGGGTNPITTPEELDAMGIAIALHPLMLLANFATGATLALEELYKSKTASGQMGAMTELQAMNKLVDTKALMVKANNYA